MEIVSLYNVRGEKSSKYASRIPRSGSANAAATCSLFPTFTHAAYTPDSDVSSSEMFTVGKPNAAARFVPSRTMPIYVCICGDDCRNFEPLGRLNYRNVDKIIRNLRRMYQEKPEFFEIPTFA